MKLELITPGYAQGNLHVFLVSMVNYLRDHGHEAIGIQNPCGSDLVAVRTSGVLAALKHNPTHILWIDSDMTFECDLASRLLAHDKDVVTCNTVVKDFRGVPSATNSTVPSPDGSDQVSSTDKTGLEKIKRIGMGIMMVKADVFSRIQFPWFGHKWYVDLPVTGWSEVGYKQGIAYAALDPAKWRTSFEDWYFCERLQDAGIDIWLDHDASQTIGHRGTCVFRQAGVSIT